MKVVFLAPYGAQQDSFELMQRFDIDGTVVTMAAYDTQGYLNGLRNIGHYWPELWPTAEGVRENVRQAIAGDWDAVVMSWIPTWSNYPADVRQAILEKVAAGRTLMIGELNAALTGDIAGMGLKLEETAIAANRFAFPDSD